MGSLTLVPMLPGAINSTVWLNINPVEDQRDLRIKVAQIQSERPEGVLLFTAEEIAKRLGIEVGSRRFRDVEEILGTCFLCRARLSDAEMASGRQTCARCVKSMGEQQPE